jgi:hypothetical protein
MTSVCFRTGFPCIVAIVWGVCIGRSLIAQVCEFPATYCNTWTTPINGQCCTNTDEDIRITPCGASGMTVKVATRDAVVPRARCGDFGLAVGGVCTTTLVGPGHDCGGDLAYGGCTQVPCPGS